MQKHLYENFVFLCVALAAFFSEPTVLRAQQADYSPLAFSTPLKLTRGELRPLYQNAQYISRENSCRLAKDMWGWSACDNLELILLEPMPGLDTVIVNRPSSTGFVQFDDWDANSPKAVDEIWGAFVDSAKIQSERTGFRIDPIGWHLRPALIKQKAVLYYSLLMKWDGSDTINAKATLFDRYGHTTFALIPSDPTISAVKLQAITEEFLSSYKSAPKADYFSFEGGDKVAAGGAVGVLATLMGVKYGKVAAAGLFAVLLAFAKKFAFLALFLPVALWRWLRKKA